jgi:hypothetical protein
MADYADGMPTPTGVLVSSPGGLLRRRHRHLAVGVFVHSCSVILKLVADAPKYEDAGSSREQIQRLYHETVFYARLQERWSQKDGVLCEGCQRGIRICCWTWSTSAEAAATTSLIGGA